MIDLTTKQLSWVVVAVLPLGGTGYMSINDANKNMGKDIAVISTKVESTERRLDAIIAQLDKIDAKLEQNRTKK